MEFKEELELLLNNFIVTKGKNKDNYYKIKSKIKKLREFTISKLGCDIIINSSLIKLEKLPSKIDNTFKIEEFDNQKDYVLFVLIIMFLEDKSSDDQFILSNLVTFINNTLANIENKKIIINFNDYSSRKSLIDVIKYATKLGIIKLIDGKEEEFASSLETEALYENTGVSRYIIRQFKDDIFDFREAKDFLMTSDTEELLNKKRYYTYRTLLYYPIFHYKDFESEVYNYFLNYRNRIINDLNNLLDGELLIYKNMAILTTEDKASRLYFPNNRKMLHDIILLVNTYLSNEYRNENTDNIKISNLEFEQLLRKVHKENSMYFNKDFREMNIDKFKENVIDAMKSFNFLNINNNMYEFSPSIFLIQGYYLQDDENTDDTFEQLSLGVE